jgi:hypothetical protein
MQSANECSSLVCSSIKYGSYAKIAKLKTTFLVDEDIGGYNKQKKSAKEVAMKMNLTDLKSYLSHLCA